MFNLILLSALYNNNHINTVSMQSTPLKYRRVCVTGVEL